jgi:uncharacterized protein (TIGR01244 family)
MTRVLLTTTLVSALFFAPSTAAAQAADLSSIRNFLRVNTDFCTGGQPRPDDFAKLKAEGVRSVLNLRTPSEYRMQEELDAVKAAGLQYFNIPVVFPDAQPEQVDAFLALTDSPSNRPMFIHCAAAVRVGAFWMVRRVLRDGWTIEAAADEARKIGLNNKRLEDFARKYIMDHQRPTQ